jgi:signal transduction histidine kinase
MKYSENMRILKVTFFILISLLLSYGVCAQINPLIDSLQQALPSVKGRDRIDVLNQLGWEMKFNNPKQSEEYTNEAMNLAMSLNYNEGLALAHRNLGAIFIIQGNPAEAKPDIDKASEYIEKTSNSFQKAKIKNLKAIILRETHRYKESIVLQQEALQIFRSLNDTAEITGNLHNLAILYQRLLDEDQALKLYLEVYDIENKRQNHFGISRTANNLGGIYDRLGKLDKAIQLYRSSVASSKIIGNRQFESAAYHQLANIFLETGKSDSALIYYEIAATINKELGFFEYLGNNLYQMAETYRFLGKTDEAIPKYLESADVFRSNQDLKSMANSFNQLALIYIDIKEYDLAKNFAKKAMHEYKKLPADDILANIYTNFYRISKANGLYNESLGFLEKSVNLSDSLSEAARNKELNEIETRYEVRKIEEENSKLMAENELKAKAIRTQQLITLVLVLMVIVILVAIFFVNRSKRQLRALNLQLELQSREMESKAVELETANSTKDMLFSIIAHDIRNPFSAVLNFSELLIEEIETIDKQTLRMYADNINLSALNTFVLLENLLFWSKSQRGTISVQPSDVNLHKMGSDVLKTAGANASENTIKLINALPEELVLHTDPTLLRIILGNLTGNAIRYNKIGGSVELWAGKSGNYIEIKVIDSGKGLEKDKIKKILEGKGRVAVPEKGKPEGTGLGMVLCIDFIKRLGGDLSIESKPGEGSVFSFRLPL